MENTAELIVENWKAIEGFPNYEVSDLGNVRLIKGGIIKNLKKVLNTSGNKQVSLIKEGKQSLKLVSRLVLAAFVGKSKLQAIHIDRDKTNDRLSNLKYGTNRENQAHHSIVSQKTSNYIGVCKRKGTKNWQSEITIDFKNIYLGRYEDEKEAADMYQLALKMFEEGELVTRKTVTAKMKFINENILEDNSEKDLKILEDGIEVNGNFYSIKDILTKIALKNIFDNKF